MFESLKNYLETHALRTDGMLASKERRLTRRLGRDANAERKEAEEIEHILETSEDRDEIIKAFEKFKKLLIRELVDVHNIIRVYKTLMHRMLTEFEELYQQVHYHASQVNAGYAAEFDQKLREFESMLEAGFKGFFQSLASFQDRNLSLAQILDDASLIHDAFYNAKMLRVEVRAIHSNLGTLQSQVKKETPMQQAALEKTFEFIKNNVRMEMSQHQKVLTDIFQLLQHFSKTIDKKIAYVKEHSAPDYPVKYPTKWAETNIRQLQSAQQALGKFMEEELAQARIEMSNEQHSDLHR